MANCAAIILAGGKALRMGGLDKCLSDVGGQVLLSRVVAIVAPHVDLLAISANGDPDRFHRFKLPVLPDTLGFDAGPLAGVLAGLDWAAEQGIDTLISVPGDTPFLPADLVPRLLIASKPTGTSLAASPDPTGRLRRHPTCALWPVKRRHALRASLNEGLRKVGLWADQEGASTEIFGSDPFDPFFNVNTPDDLDRADDIANAL